MTDTKLHEIRGLAVYVDCERCEGEGKAYMAEWSRVPSRCDECNGTGTVLRRLDTALVKSWLEEILGGGK